MASDVRGGNTCAIARTVDILRDPWAFLILRELFDGTTRFAAFVEHLGVATDVLTARLNTLVGAGIVAREQYREPGARSHAGYHLTDAGHELKPVLGALQQWGDNHLPVDCGPTVERRHRFTGNELAVAFVDPAGRAVAASDVDFARTPAHPAARRRSS